MEEAGAVEWMVPSKSGGMCEQEHLGLCASVYVWECVFVCFLSEMCLCVCVCVCVSVYV